MKSILQSLAAVVLVASANAADPVSAQREGKQIIFRAGEREILRYQAEPGDLPRADIKAAFRRGGYLHPLHTPSGKLVTDDFPPNHVHHHGIWFPWTKTKFEDREPDFWNMGEGRGRVEFVAAGNIWTRDGSAGFQATHRFVDLLAQPAKTALDETWEIAVFTAADGAQRNIIDLTSTQTCATAAPLILPKYYYGGLGFRGHRAWDGAPNCRILTSEGITDRLAANETRGKWCWIGGTVDGATAGVTILCHAENFRFPQPIRIHPSEPFFCFAPQQLGEMSIEPGKPYLSRYRIVITDSVPSREQVDAWWNEWAGKNNAHP